MTAAAATSMPRTMILSRDLHVAKFDCVKVLYMILGDNHATVGISCVIGQWGYLIMPPGGLTMMGLACERD